MEEDELMEEELMEEELMEEECGICGRKRGSLNKTNWEKHVIACESKQQKKKDKTEKKKHEAATKQVLKRRNTYGSQTMTKFFRKTVSPSPSTIPPTTMTNTPSIVDPSSTASSTSTVSTIDPLSSAITSDLPAPVDPSLSAITSDLPAPVDPSLSARTSDVSTPNDPSSITIDSSSTAPIDALTTATTPDVSTPSDPSSTASDLIVTSVKTRSQCQGFHPAVLDIYTDVACHILDELDIVIENRNFHHISCAENDYIVNNNNENCSSVNKLCENLKYSTRLQKVLERGKGDIKTDKGLQTTNNKFLSHNQLSEKVSLLQQQKRDMRLQLMNTKFKNSKLCATITLHERFLVLISENNVLRLQQLVKVSLNNGRSIGHIVSKVMAVIDGMYRPNPSQDDKDLAFLTLKFGGPSLLNILYRAGVLPSVSTAYRMAKACPPIVSSIQDSISDCFKANITLTETSKSAMSLKLDETYTTPELSYNSRDNQVYGTCYQHGCNVKLELDEFSDCEKIQNLIQDDQLHVPKECLVAGLAPMNENSTMQPLLMWPSCSKNDIDGTINLIKTVNNEMKEQNGYPLMNVSTDGDATRRKAVNSMMDQDAKDFSWYKHVDNLPFMDYDVGPDGITCNFDPKHMAKRCWRMLLSEKMKINGILITKKLLKEFLDGNTLGVGEDQLYPRDKQNVESATKFLLAFIEMSEKEDFPYNFMSIKDELKYLGEIFKGLLSFYVYVNMSIAEQIQCISTATYLLFVLYREHRTSLMPAQLYHDLIMSFIDVLFCCAKAKEYTPDEPLYLLRDGSDLLERFFGNVRLRFKGSNFSVLEMINSARAMSACDKILMVDHPEWSEKSRVQRRLALDYSNAAQWTREKLVLSGVNIKGTWRSGYHKALSLLPVDEAVKIEENVVTTLRCPIKSGTAVGVGVVAEKDWSLAEEEEETEEQGEDVTDEVDREMNLGEIIQDPAQKAEPFFIIEGKRVYKSSCLKAISSSQQLSKDRLRRVQGMSRYPGEKGCASHDDSLLFIGDPVLVSDPKEGPVLANIVTMKKANKNLTEIDVSSGLNEVQFTLRKIKGEEIEGKLFWKGSTAEDVFSCAGDHCLPIKPNVELNPPAGMTKYFFEMDLLRDMCLQLPVAATTTSVIKKVCFICRKKLPHADMRCHVGTHILKGDIKRGDLDKICGFCGRDVCAITLKRSSKKKSKQYFAIDKWDCQFYFDYGKLKKFHKKTNPCTNRLVRCPIKDCLSNVWVYNFQHHFDKKHKEEEFPQEMVVSEAEVNFYLK